MNRRYWMVWAMMAIGAAAMAMGGCNRQTPGNSGQSPNGLWHGSP